MTFNDPTPGFKVTAFFDAEYLRNGTRYIVSMQYYRDLHTPYLERLSKIFNDTKRRAVSQSQRQLSFLLVISPEMT